MAAIKLRKLLQNYKTSLSLLSETVGYCALDHRLDYAPENDNRLFQLRQNAIALIGFNCQHDDFFPSFPDETLNNLYPKLYFFRVRAGWLSASFCLKVPLKNYPRLSKEF
jgi:hypothetical protein